jgi:UPF0755 protein
MPNRIRHKSLVAVLVLSFLFVQPIILSCIPHNGGGEPTSLIVKKGTRLDRVARLLEENHFIRSRYLFLFSSLLFHKGKVVAGEYEIPRNLSILDITRKMARGERKVYQLRIVEGYNLSTLSEVIEKAGIMNGQAFLRLATDSAFLKRLNIPSGSCEGYFYPDTYFYSKEIDVDRFLEKIIQRTFLFFERQDVKKRMEEIGMNTFQVLSLASIIEKEARLETDKPLISAVFHNRLRLGISLDADPTVIYGLGSFKRSITKSDLVTETPYNTYRIKGLPRGPICNPSKTSIMAALHPDKSDVLYFVSRNDGSHVFSKTLREHNKYVIAYQRQGK